MNRWFRAAFFVVLGCTAALYAWEYFFAVKSVEIDAAPAAVLPGDSCTITVRFLNRAGGAVPFSRRTVEFEIVQGGEHAVLEDTRRAGVIFLHALSPGVVVIHVRVAGFAFPFERTVHISEQTG